MPSLSLAVYFSAIRYSAAAMKSSKTFCFLPLVPGLAVLAAAAQVGLGENHALLQQGDQQRAEAGLDADVEAAVGRQEAGIRPVQDQALLVDDEHRHLGPVLAGVEDLLGLIALGVELDLGLAEDLGHAGGDVVLEDGRRIGERGEGVEEGRVVAPAAQSAGGAEGRERDLADRLPVQPILEDLGVGILEVGAEQLAAAGGRAVQDFGLLGDDDGPVFLGRLQGIDQDELPVGSLKIGLDQELAADVVDDRAVVVEALHQQGEGRAGLGQVAPVELRAGGAFAEGDEGELLVLGDAGADVAQGMVLVLEDHDVLFLRVADLVIEDLLELVLGS